MPLTNYDARLLRARVGVIGDAAVGKTALLKAFERKHYYAKDYRMTLASELTVQIVELPEHSTNVELYCIEAAGHALYQSKRVDTINPATTATVLVCYDVTSRDSYISAINTFKQFRQAAQSFQYGLLVACKADLAQSVDTAVANDEAVTRATELGLEHVVTSAATGENVEEVFRMIALHVVKQFADTQAKLEHSHHHQHDDD